MSKSPQHIEGLKLALQASDRKLGDAIRLLSSVSHSTAKYGGFWARGNSTSQLGVKLALIHSEVSEALEELRKGEKGDKFLEELADIVIRTFDLAGSIDHGSSHRFGEILIIKMIKNLSREFKHGKEF